MSRKQQNPLSIPVLVASGPDKDHKKGEATWFHPDSQAHWAIRQFGRCDIDRLAGELSVGQRERFLSILSVLQAIGRKDQSKIQQASERLDSAASLIREERGALANSLLSMTDQSVPIGVGEQKGVLTTEPSALSDLAGMLMKPDRPPISRQADSQRVLSSEITSELRNVRLVLWLTSGRFRPALYSQTNLAAAYAFTLLGDWVGWEVCVNCGTFFRQSRPNEKWCKPACGNAYRVRKSQAKKRAEVAGAKKSRRIGSALSPRDNVKGNTQNQS